MFSAFRSRNYALFWAGSFVSDVGSWMQSVALGWLLYEMTHSASWLGLVSFAANAPSLFVGPLGGAVADRTDYKTVLLGAQAFAATTAFLLAGLTATGLLRIWQVVTIALATGTALALYMPVVHAMVPALVPPENLLNAISLNSVRFNLARIIGPLAAGFAYATVGAAGCFFLNGVTFVALLFALNGLRLPAQPVRTPASLRSQLLEGIRYARSERIIVAMLILASAVSLFGFPYIILMPAMARDALHLGPEGLGIMMGSVGAGAVVGGLGLASAGDLSRKALVASAAGGALAVNLIAFSLASSLATAMPLLFLLGFTQVACVASLNTTLQVTVTNAMRGRVMSMLTFSLFGLSTLGSLLLGVLGDHVGVPRALRLGGGIILSVVAAIASRFWRSLVSSR